MTSSLSQVSAGAASPWTGSILLLEDNDDDVFLMKRALKQAGITNPLSIVTDGEEAINFLAGSGVYGDRSKYPLPNLAFLDLKVPFVNGFEVLAWIRSKREFDPLITVVLTSSAEQRDQERARALGAYTYLVKPPTPKMLADLIQTLPCSGA